MQSHDYQFDDAQIEHEIREFTPDPKIQRLMRNSVDHAYRGSARRGRALPDNAASLLVATEGFIRSYEWDWYVTLTFRRPVAYQLADKLFRAWLNWCDRRSFGNNYLNRPGDRLRWIRADETEGCGLRHFHVLMGRVGPKCSLEEAQKKWAKLPHTEDARIEVYDCTMGAPGYLLKHYPAKGNIDLGGAWNKPTAALDGIIRDSRHA